MRRGVLSPPAAASGRWIGHPTDSLNAGRRLETIGGERIAPRLPKARVAMADGELVSIHDVQAYQLAGCQNGRGVLGPLGPLAASAGWHCASSCGKPPAGWRFDAVAGCVSDSLDGGGGTLSGDSRKRRLPPSAFPGGGGVGPKHGNADLRPNWLPPRQRGANCLIDRPGGLLPGPGQRQLPG